uniref:TYR_PHOSPHATASE_2 domain-containing protein n=1 Tax=Caenorhabditis japonica TaxID=281687 RepID=A0A8R1HUH5_CAEJA
MIESKVHTAAFIVSSATYSALRTGILSLTPGDHKCRLYCSGSKCRFCVVDSEQNDSQAIPGLYSTWITDDILAMSRLQEDHFTKIDIVEKFRENQIKSVVNLQESGEHSFCGNGNLPSGFSYDPESLMKGGSKCLSDYICLRDRGLIFYVMVVEDISQRKLRLNQESTTGRYENNTTIKENNTNFANSVFHYNFPLPDFQACSLNRLLDIVKVVDFALSNGRIAVHCHAGHGRTGMVIAAWMMYALGLSPSQAVEAVRSRRAKAVQSKEQVETLHKFRLLIRNNGGMIIPKHKLARIQEYVAYNQKFISKPESRLYGKIPKIAYTSMRLVMLKMYSSVSFDIDSDFRLTVKCGEPLASNKSLDEELLDSQLNDEDHEKTYYWYQEQVKKGLTVSTINKNLETEDFRDILRLLDLFFHSTFHQLTHKEEIFAVLENWDQTEKVSF